MRFLKVGLLVGALSTGLLGVKCLDYSTVRVESVSLTLSQDRASLKVSAQLPEKNHSSVSGSFAVQEYGSLLVQAYSTGSKLSFGFDLAGTLFSDTGYGALTPVEVLANGVPMPNDKAMVEIPSGLSGASVNLYGYVDIKDQKWMGMSAILTAVDDANFPEGLNLTQWYDLDETGLPRIVAYVNGPVLGKDGVIKTAGQMSVFVKVAAYMSSGLEPGVMKTFKKVREYYTYPPALVAATPTPTPTPTATPTPTPGASSDAIDATSITWDDTNPSTWAITAVITKAGVTSKKITAVRDPLDSWPHKQESGWDKPSVGNWWIIAKCPDGKWHGATMEYLGVNRTEMNNPGFDGGDDIHGCIGTYWRPVSGETAYLMLSTFARAYVDANNKQRTNIVKVTMP